MGLLDELRTYHNATADLQWTGSFEEYLEKVKAQPAIAQMAHHRLNAMIQSHGQVATSNGPIYPFFGPHLIGSEKALRSVMEYLEGAAQGLDVRKRVLLLIGPPGSGKSSLLITLKRALEAWTRTDAGAVYGIVGCPLHEEPLHLVPDSLRPTFAKELGVPIEGDLCPVCQQRVQQGVDPMEFQVERLVFSERDRVGLGTYVPGSEKDMDIAQLVGSLDFAKIAEYGSESDPRAFSFDGELDIANRGIMEMQEFLKLTPEMKYVLLGLAQERTIKTPRFALISADEVVIAHSNLNEYHKFVGDKANEAIANRMYVVFVPYALKTTDETQIYQHMLAETQAMQATHIAPHTLHALARFVVLTRLQPPKDTSIDLWTKMQLYNGEPVGDYTDHNLRELQAEFPHEGLSGLSPRDAMNVLVHAMGFTTQPCISPIDVLRAIQIRIDKALFLADTHEKDQERLRTFRVLVRKELDRLVREDVQSAFIEAFDENAQALFAGYLEHAEAWDNKDQLVDPVTGEPRDPDVAFLRSLEAYAGVSEGAASAFRTEILKKRGAILSKGDPFRWDAHPRLAQGIRDKLFADAQSVMVGALTARTPDIKQQRRLREVQDRLETKGYCEHCAPVAMNYAGYLLQHPEKSEKKD